MSSIGVFDSGFGGLSILKEIVRVLPQYDFVYLGDTARAPYGDRSQETIYEFTKEGVEFLFNQKCDLTILACNTASAEALRKIQQEFLPKYYPGKKVLGVLIPAAENAVEKTKVNRIGILGTEATIESGAFTREIQKLNSKIKIFGVAAPLLVPLVEAGETKSESANLLVADYIKKISRHGIDTLILGCTHYSFFESEIKKNIKNVTIITEGKVVGNKLKTYLNKHSDIDRRLSKKGKRVFYTTDSKEKFDKFGSRFFGSKIDSRKIDLK